MDITPTEESPDVTREADSAFIPGTFDEVLTLAGFPSGDIDSIASPKYLASLSAACNMDGTALIFWSDSNKNKLVAGKMQFMTERSNADAHQGVEMQTDDPDGSASQLSQQSVVGKQKSQIYALDRFIRSIRLSINVQENESKANILSSLRNTQGYLLKIEDEIAENRKLHTQSVIHNKKHSYMVNELRLQLFESYLEADIRHREQHLKQLNRIEDLEKESSKQVKRVEALKIQLAQEKLARGKAARILLNEHDPVAAKDEALMLLKPHMGLKLPPSLKKDLESNIQDFHVARDKLFRETVAQKLLDM
ncbi:uncharacterized protein C8R40DRAFT_1173444 [Lentinula edodes]|uniref:uncharacterized protein n=1 Tax=Lentinula edodes TaxID=5353 RepID=UPI001E8D1D70|nr:uncharacterized protein C8R40DRAFT_1173444 [Lentinula edodes]KAH7872696.1 hypothetical protein C8R40DRAFT_1173444 [Lentinula edodes]